MQTVLDGFWTDLLGGGGNMINVINNLQGRSSQIAIIIALIYIGYKVMLYFSDVNSKLDPFVIIRPCMVVGAISIYPGLVDLLILRPMGIIDAIIAEALAPIGSPASIDTAFDTGMKYVFPGSAGIPGVYDIVAINPFLEVLHLIIYFAATVVGFYILLRQVVIAAIYYVIGLLALPLSLAIGNQSVMGSWFFGFISIMLWEPILRILKGIIVELQVPSVTFTSGIVSIAMQVVLILTILQIPKYANSLVSKGSELGSGIGDTISRSIRKKGGLA
jgi:hypothetical protein